MTPDRSRGRANSLVRFPSDPGMLGLVLEIPGNGSSARSSLHGNSDMHRAHPRWPAAAGLPVLLALFAGLLLLPVPSWSADPPKPKIADSRPRIKPKEAELTTSVEPAAAKPGQTVTFKVTAKLKPGYHIYKYTKTKTPPGSGPSSTTFDFFDTAGLEAEGDWTASK